MTATEELRRLLDERGVEYEMDDTQVDGNGTMYRVTYVKEGYGRTWVYEEPPECGLLVSYDHDLGAEDAIAATLGAGTCKDVCSGTSEFTCSACGFNCDLTSWISLFDGDDGRHRHHHYGTPHYCPNCGRRVVDE